MRKYQIAMAVSAVLLSGFSLVSFGADLPVSFQQMAKETLEGNKIGGVGFVRASSNLIYVGTEGGHISLYHPQENKFTNGPNLNREGLQYCFCSWSPDGKKIAYLVNGDIYVHETDSSDTSRLTNTGTTIGIAWKSDHEMIFDALEERPKKSSRISLIDLNSKEVKTLIKGEVRYWVDSFAPDTGKLFFSRTLIHDVGDRVFYQADVKNGVLKNQKKMIDSKSLRFADTDLSVTSDGKYAVVTAFDRNQPPSRDLRQYDTYRYDIYMVETQTGKYLRLASSEAGWASNENAKISGDGAFLLAESNSIDNGGAPSRVVRYARLEPAAYHKLFAKLPVTKQVSRR